MRSVEVHDQPVERAEAGQRVAASLVGDRARRDPARGEPRHAGRVARELSARRRARGARGRPGRDARRARPGPARHGLRRRARGAARGRERSPPGSAGLAQLRLRELVAAARGDRVILRTTAPQATVAGGVVLDPAPPRHGAAASALERLRLLAGGDAPSLVRAALEAAPWPLALASVAPPGLLERAAALTALAQLRESGEVLQLAGAEPAWLTATRYAELRDDGRRAARASRRRAPARARAARRTPSCPPAPARKRCWHGSPPTACSSATAPTSCAPGARADATGGHTAEAEALLAALDDRRLHAARPARAAAGIRAARARVRGAGSRARARRPDRPLRRRPGLHERALRARRENGRGALHASTARSRWPSCATTSARAAGSRRRCSSDSTPTGSRGASKTAACCAAAASA